MTTPFDQLIDRRSIGSTKWHHSDDTLPMWIADMDFKVADPIANALIHTIQTNVLGYTDPTPSLYQAIINWHHTRYHHQLSAQDILFSSSVVASLATMINLFSQQGDAILINDPVYPAFIDKIKRNHRTLITSPLKIDPQNRFRFDYQDMEEKIRQHNVKLFILCNPHNPGGRVWDKEELQQILTLCKRHNVFLVSDEIHQDLALFGHRTTSILSLEEAHDYSHRLVCLTAISKTFNTAGLKGSLIFTKDPTLKETIAQYQIQHGENEINLLALQAMQAAYQHGNDWLEAVINYIENNVNTAIEYLQTHSPKLTLMRPEASYLIWINCAGYCQDNQELKQKLLNAKVELNSGITYGKQGHLQMRLNVACPKAILQQGLERICQALS